MRVYTFSRRLYRFIVLLLLLLLILPVLHYYLVTLANPLSVHFRKPRGEALKVSLDVDLLPGELGTLNRLGFYSKEFLQNGL
jgi:hypothetical protein